MHSQKAAVSPPDRLEAIVLPSSDTIDTAVGLESKHAQVPQWEAASHGGTGQRGGARSVGEEEVRGRSTKCNAHSIGMFIWQKES